MSTPQSTFEEHRALILGCIVLSVLLIYHLYLFYTLRHSPSSTVLGVTRATRRIWAAELMQPPESASHTPHVVAVHTLRNWNMSNTMMASSRFGSVILHLDLGSLLTRCFQRRDHLWNDFLDNRALQGLVCGYFAVPRNQRIVGPIQDRYLDLHLHGCFLFVHPVDAVFK